MKKFLSLVMLTSGFVFVDMSAGLGDIIGAGLVGAGAVADEAVETAGDIVGGPYHEYYDYDDDGYYPGYYGRRYYNYDGRGRRYYDGYGRRFRHRWGY